MRIFLAIFLPFIVFLSYKKIGSAVVCLILQLLGFCLTFIPFMTSIGVSIMLSPTFWAILTIADKNVENKIKDLTATNTISD